MAYNTFELPDVEGEEVGLSYNGVEFDISESSNNSKPKSESFRFTFITIGVIILMLVGVAATLNSQYSSLPTSVVSSTYFKSTGKNDVDSKQNQVEEKEVTIEVKNFDDALIEGLSAPVTFQSIDNDNFMYKITQKYGIDGDGYDESKRVYDFAGGKGWVYVTIYPHGNCQGVEYSVGGIMTGTCYTLESESNTDDYNTDASIMFGCDGETAVVNRFKGSSCKTLLKAVNLTSNECGSLSSSSWNRYAIDSDKLYGVIQCSQATSLPISGNYAVMRAFLDKTPTSFEALKMDTCMDVDWNSESQSVLFKANTTSNEPYMEYYDGSSNCGGDPDTTYSLNLQEEELTAAERGDSTVSYKWEYYSTTAAPSETTISDAPVENPVEGSVPTAMPTESLKSYHPSLPLDPSTPTVSEDPESATTFMPTETLKTYHPSLPLDPSAPTVLEDSESETTFEPTGEVIPGGSVMPTENVKTYHPSLPLDPSDPIVLEDSESATTFEPTGEVITGGSVMPTENAKTYHPSLPLPVV